jgi:Family of unknown function (DUF6282)
MTGMTRKFLGLGLSLSVACWAGACGGGDTAEPAADQAAAPAAAAPVASDQWDSTVSFDEPEGPRDMGLRDPALVGSIEVHAHLNPDISGGGQAVRSLDVIDNARMSKAVGARGFVYKTHMEMSSAQSAYLARKEVPGMEVYARYAMNLTSGGLNPAAVTMFTQTKGGWGRIVEFTTRDINEPQTENRPWIMPWDDLFPNFPRKIDIVRNGQVTQDAKDIITLVGRLKTIESNGHVVMATGHTNADTAIALIREARKQGVDIMWTHPGDNISDDLKKEASGLGAYVEVMADINQAGDNHVEKADYAAQLGHVWGVERSMIGSDCGQMNNPFPTDCLANLARALRARGYTESELDMMYKQNPVKFLQLPAAN